MVPTAGSLQTREQAPAGATEIARCKSMARPEARRFSMYAGGLHHRLIFRDASGVREPHSVSGWEVHDTPKVFERELDFRTLPRAARCLRSISQKRCLTLVRAPAQKRRTRMVCFLEFLGGNRRANRKEKQYEETRK